MIQELFRMAPERVRAGAKDWLDQRRSRMRHGGALAQLLAVAQANSDRCLASVSTLEGWDALRPVARKQLAWMLGIEPLPERTPLHSRVAGVVEREVYRIAKLVFESMPGLFVTANFYMPKGHDGPCPCVLYLNGHWPSLCGAKTGYQDRYLWYPAHGFALLVVDPLGFGEIPGIHHGTNHLNRWEWLSLGYTPAGVEVWNAMRALDWLETRPEVDASRIGVTGISGGGVMTHYLAALDERVAVAAPSCSTYTIGTQVAMGLVPQQCDCTFFPNVYGLDLPDVDALIAPRPLLILGGRKDPIFPPKGFRDAFQRAKRVYDLYPPDDVGRERIRLIESGQGHTDPPAFLRETRAWMVKWLAMEGSVRSEELASGSSAPEDPKNLICLDNPPATALNYHVHDVWIRQAVPSLPANMEAWRSRRDELLSVLRDRIFGWVPAPQESLKTRPLRHSGGYIGQFATFSEAELVTEADVRVKVQLVTPRRPVLQAPLIVWVRGATDQGAFPDLDECLPLIRSSVIMTVTPRFADAPLPAPLHARIEREAALVGRTIAAMQVADVLAAVRWARSLQSQPLGRVFVCGRGEAGIIGLYAAILEEAIAGVILRDPPSSHRQGPALLTILRDSDLCETAALLAPRDLVFLRAMPSAYDWTRGVYRLVGAAGRLAVAPSLAEAVFALEGKQEMDGATAP
jgi:cephalosporin-C deacetylase-like acetyl esterase